MIPQLPYSQLCVNRFEQNLILVGFGLFRDFELKIKKDKVTPALTFKLTEIFQIYSSNWISFDSYYGGLQKRCMD